MIQMCLYNNLVFNDLTLMPFSLNKNITSNSIQSLTHFQKHQTAHKILLWLLNYFCRFHRGSLSQFVSLLSILNKSSSLLSRALLYTAFKNRHSFLKKFCPSHLFVTKIGFWSFEICIFDKLHLFCTHIFCQQLA